MFIDDQTYTKNNKIYRRILLRNSYRINGKIHHDTIANLSQCSQEEIDALNMANPGLQGVSAAIENLMLSAGELGYGTCWMTSPNYAAKEISEYVNFNKEGCYLAALTPLGVPATEGKSPERKPLEEVITVIE